MAITYSFAVTDHARLAGAITAMARQTPDARHAADTYQRTRGARHHRRNEWAKGVRHTHQIGGDHLRHHIQVRPQGRIHANTDAGIGNDHIWQALAL